MTTVFVICAVALVLAAAITSFRLVRGPNSLDRLVAVDMLVALSVCGLAVWTAFTRDTTLISAIVALTLLGFIGSIAITRYRVPDTTVEEEPT
ncbi:cation:proton antiporter [Hoyosella rhizosphaerae]|uniref:Cation antiporter subunit n=1 Tax=Hoyosella rhizosphaerae TaxID=1755582 RepID=A0A916XBN9_9ACTN|nr:monovalent cation/H+ antiporter complex subunit F [Hoyosella rhizosphaerae]MBN4927779.1 cation:proton antiporter [Hoyosella rhizosphaerae]GGC61605.1 putative cation antiporter subunit [Hoyosella rhizosphaerae]